jgi:RNA polymerase sigma factor (sigma-70 family)
LAGRELRSVGSVDEHDLIRAAQAGRSDALDELLARGTSELRAYIESRLSGKTKSLITSEDVLQEVWLDVCLKIGQFRYVAPGSFQAWLRRLAVRTIVDVVRHWRADKRGGQLRRREFTAAGGDLHAWFDSVVHGRSRSSPSRGAMRGDSARALNELIELLPEQYRTLVKMELQGASNEAIADALGKKIGAFYTAKSRAHDELERLIRLRISESRSLL